MHLSTAIAVTIACTSSAILHGGGEVLTPELGFGDWTYDDSTGLGSLQVTWNSEEVLAGFQFDLPNLVITGASGGLAADAGFAIAYNDDRVIGYFTTMDGYIYPTKGTEVLLEIAFENTSDTDLVVFDGVVCARPDASSIDVISDDEIILDAPCLPDFNADGYVDGADLTLLLANWGVCQSVDCQYDLTGDLVVDGADLTVLLAGWGACP